MTLDDAASTFVLAHVEIEGEASGDMGARMHFYNMQLYVRDQLPVFPVVIFLSGGRPGLNWARHEVKVLDDVISDFRYLSLGLSQMEAEMLLARKEPLAWALAAFARAKRGKAWLKLECLKRIARAGLDGVRQFLLVDAVETRLQLRNRDEEEYRRLLESEHPQEVIQMEMTWSAQIESRAEARGRQEGRLEGRQEGWQEGRKALVKRLLTARFGPLPESAVQRLEAITAVEELDALGERLLTASSLEELGLL